MGADVYLWAEQLFNEGPSYAHGFDQLLATRPYFISADDRVGYESRLRGIREFQRIAIEIFRSAIDGNADASILHWLLNETPECLGVSFHRNLEDRHFTAPVFFRSDEVKAGRIVEIQCPGSLWGELQLMHEYAARLGFASEAPSPAIDFVAQLTRMLSAAPVVDHRLDNASGPAGMLYFIKSTRLHAKYWRIDRGIRPENCNFIRNHSFFGLCSDNDFLLRLARTGPELVYDLPPHVLFDQKAALVLPFWSATRESFSDDVRSIFVFSTPLLPTGIELPDGRHCSIEEFSRFSRRRRGFYLKYAGSNVSLNWGSRAVYRLSNMSSEDCLIFLKRCLEKYRSGQIWMIQEEETQDDTIEFFDRHGHCSFKKLRAKFSGFYGPYNCLGVLAMHRQRNKVHGQSDTVLSPVLEKAVIDNG